MSAVGFICPMTSLVELLMELVHNQISCLGKYCWVIKIVKSQFLVVKELEVMFFAHVACRGYKCMLTCGTQRQKGVNRSFFLVVLLVLF